MAEAQNPFADPLRFERQVPECAIVIFGANGDLTKRKLIPSLYRLAYERRLPATACIIGTSRPHRRLSVQANRSEYPGLPLRHRHFRAAMEPALCEPCADHGRRIDRRR